MLQVQNFVRPVQIIVHDTILLGRQPSVENRRRIEGDKQVGRKSKHSVGQADNWQTDGQRSVLA